MILYGQLGHCTFGGHFVFVTASFLFYFQHAGDLFINDALFVLVEHQAHQGHPTHPGRGQAYLTVWNATHDLGILVAMIYIQILTQHVLGISFAIVIVVPGKSLAECTDAIFFCGLEFPVRFVSNIFGFGAFGIQGLDHGCGSCVHGIS